MTRWRTQATNVLVMSSKWWQCAIFESWWIFRYLASLIDLSSPSSAWVSIGRNCWSRKLRVPRWIWQKMYKIGDRRHELQTFLRCHTTSMKWQECNDNLTDIYSLSKSASASKKSKFLASWLSNLYLKGYRLNSNISGCNIAEQHR